MKLIIEIYKSNELSDTDDECVKALTVELDSSATIDDLLSFAEGLGQDDCETLNRMRFYRAEDGTEF